MDQGVLFLILVLIVLGILGVAGFRYVSGGFGGTVTFLGRPKRNVREGPTWIIPLVESLRIIDVRALPVNPTIQGVLTRDQIPVDVDLFMLRQVTDPKRAIYRAANIDTSIEELARGALVASIGQFTITQLGDPAVQIQVAQQIENVLSQVTVDRLGTHTFAHALQQIRRPAVLENAAANFQAEVINAQARVVRARGEAEQTTIERGAQGDDWLGATWADAFIDVGKTIAGALAQFAQRKA